MWHGVIWTVMLALGGAWSLACWALHGLLRGAASATAGGWLDWLAQWQIPVWLTPWLPMEAITALKTLLTAAGPWLEAVLAQAPGLMAWLTPLLWLAWALGMLALALAGGLLSLLVQAVRASAPAPAGAAGAQAAATPPRR